MPPGEAERGATGSPRSCAREDPNQTSVDEPLGQPGVAAVSGVPIVDGDGRSSATVARRLTSPSAAGGAAHRGVATRDPLTGRRTGCCLTVRARHHCRASRGGCSR
jgi:hypothetical protein